MQINSQKHAGDPSWERREICEYSDIYRSTDVVEEQVCQRIFPSGKFVPDSCWHYFSDVWNKLGGWGKCCRVFLVCTGDTTGVFWHRSEGGESCKGLTTEISSSPLCCSFSTSTNPFCPDIVLPESRENTFKSVTFGYIFVSFLRGQGRRVKSQVVPSPTK